MFVQAYIKGLRHMTEASSDLERLRFMPQKMENGELINFEGNTLLKVPGVKDMIIFDADRVNNTKRYTAALTRDYFNELDKVLPLFVDKVDNVEESPVKKEYASDILDAVASGDKKLVRSLLSEYKATEWKDLVQGDVDYAMFEINDCVADKDVDSARNLIAELINCDICESEDAETPAQTQCKTDEPKTNTHTPINEDEKELLQDLEEAVEDADWEDVEMLLKELGKGHPRYNEFADKIPSEDSEKENAEQDDVDLVKEICLDIDDALGSGDFDDAKDILKELEDEVGADAEIYIEYAAKVNPKKERRSRRGK